jgi:hypothetical protein
VGLSVLAGASLLVAGCAAPASVAPAETVVRISQPDTLPGSDVEARCREYMAQVDLGSLGRLTADELRAFGIVAGAVLGQVSGLVFSDGSRALTCTWDAEPAGGVDQWPSAYGWSFNVSDRLDASTPVASGAGGGATGLGGWVWGAVRRDVATVEVHQHDIDPAHDVVVVTVRPRDGWFAALTPDGPPCCLFRLVALDENGGELGREN